MIQGYCILPKYSDRQARANGIDPDQMPHYVASNQALHFCDSSSSFKTHRLVVKWTSLNFRTSMARS